jgi:hypothetical protein
MTTRLAIPLVLALAMILAGCAADDDPTAPSDRFAIDITVVDGHGQPVPGLRISLSPDVEDVHWPLAGPPGPVDSAPRIDLPDPLLVTLEIFAVDGRRVRHEVREGIVAVPAIAWDGRDDEGRPVHDGWYEGRLSTAPDAQTPPQEVLRRGLLYISGTPEHHAAGVTDGAGKVVVTDRTYVPAFWNVGPIEILSAYGEVVDTIEVPLRTRVILLADDGAAMAHVFEPVDGPQTVSIVWAP